MTDFVMLRQRSIFRMVCVILWGMQLFCYNWTYYRKIRLTYVMQRTDRNKDVLTYCLLCDTCLGYIALLCVAIVTDSYCSGTINLTEKFGEIDLFVPSLTEKWQAVLRLKLISMLFFFRKL